MGCSSSSPKEGIICTIDAEYKEKFMGDSEPPQLKEDLERSGLLVSEVNFFVRWLFLMDFIFQSEFGDFQVFVKQLNGTIRDCYAYEEFQKIKKLQKVSFIGCLCLWGVLVVAILIVSPEISSVMSPGVYSPRAYILLGMFVNYILYTIMSKCLRWKKDRVLMETLNPYIETFNERNKVRSLTVQFKPRKWKHRFGRHITYRRPAKLLLMRDLNVV